MAQTGDRVKRGLRVLRSFLGGLKVKMAELEIGLDIDPETGAADSGDIEIDLPNLFEALGEAAKEKKSAVAILIDEIQYLNQKELGAVIMAMHRMQHRQLPAVLLGAGLPVLPGLADESKSYAERLFAFPDIDPLSEADSNKAVSEPALVEGVKLSDAALAETYRLTHGYPYFIQEWGYQMWNLAASSPIELGVVQSAAESVVRRLDQNFFRVRFDRLTPGEKNFLRAMAELGSGAIRSGDIASCLGVKTTAFDLQLNPAHPSMSLHLAKGLEFHAVVVVACDDEVSHCKNGLRRRVTMLTCKRCMTPSGICFTWPARARGISCW